MKEIIRRLYYLKEFKQFKNYGKNIFLSKGGSIAHPEQISFGSNIFIARNFHISAFDLNFGNDIMIGPNLVIECHNHQYDKIGMRMFNYSNEKKYSKVTFEDDIWIGANVTILANAYISEGTIIGACSLINKYLPPYTVCLGIPAKPVKCRFTLDQLESHLESIESKYNLSTIAEIWKKYNLI